MREYDQLAGSGWYASHRNPQTGIEDVCRFVASLPNGATVLDLGCGDGIPISRFLFERGFSLYGIDSSSRMIEQFARNLPGVPAECSDLLQSDLFGRAFDAVIAYGLMFHFPLNKQVAVIAKVSEHLLEGGKFLFNSSSEQGETVSEMNAVKVAHWSMSATQYAQTLHKHHLVLAREYADKQSGSYVYVAEKRVHPQKVCLQRGNRVDADGWKAHF
ncbi:MAG: class I SAM-dependent methyltransferase [Verrucomicrobia bacterium]|nr:class I SAM-dependent methyltransferase [Verrucomicrobiota bacterium]